VPYGVPPAYVPAVKPIRAALFLKIRDLVVHHLNEWFARDVAPSFYPATIGVWSSVMPCWAVVAAVRGAKPSVGRSAADRRAAA
jgi:hypothetical protein